MTKKNEKTTAKAKKNNVAKKQSKGEKEMQEEKKVEQVEQAEQAEIIEKRTRTMETQLDEEQGIIVMLMSDEAGNSLEPLRVDTRKLPAHVLQIAALYGIRARLTACGNSAETIEAKHRQRQNIVEGLYKGQWFLRAKNGNASGRIPQVVQALMRIYGISIEKAAEWFESKSNVERNAIKSDPRVMEEIAAIRAENVPLEKVEAAGDLLAELEIN